MTMIEFDEPPSGRQSSSPGSGKRNHIPAATQAALWALGNRHCYFPGCSQPLVVEVRPGVYRKNATISHIYGVARNAPRHRRRLGDDERDSYTNLILLCLAHSEEIDDPTTGQRLYPPKKLHEWKTAHEGAAGPTLAALGDVTEQLLTELITDAFTPPLNRLQQITDELAQTGTLTAATVTELRQIVSSLSDRAGSVDAQTAANLLEAAAVFDNGSFRNLVGQLVDTASTLPDIIRSLPKYEY